jgi:hypothetical protein
MRDTLIDMAKASTPSRSVSLSDAELGGPIAIVCSRCGSRNVNRDASAAWNTSTQEWELCGLCDQGYCEDCGGEANLEEIPLHARKDGERNC